MEFNFDTIIGIDPGASGGLAVFQPGKLTKTVKMPKDVRDLAEFFGYYAENFKPLVFLEKLSVRPDDVKDNPGKIYRIQQMMANYEHLKALMETAGLPYVLVHPAKWMTYLGLRLVRKGGTKETKQQRKNRYKLFAQNKYPEVNVTLWNADALNIMHFGRKVLVNDPNWVKSNLPKKELEKLF